MTINHRPLHEIVADRRAAHAALKMAQETAAKFDAELRALQAALRSELNQRSS